LFSYEIKVGALPLDNPSVGLLLYQRKVEQQNTSQDNKDDENDQPMLFLPWFTPQGETGMITFRGVDGIF